jgi:hypothetical protein
VTRISVDSAIGAATPSEPVAVGRLNALPTMPVAKAGPAPEERVMRLAQTDWLHHRMTVSGPPGDLAAFQSAARGAGIIPWHLDLDRLEEDWFLRLAAPRDLLMPRLSAAGARRLAAQLRDAVARRHAIAVSAVGVSQACPFDLHSLVPVPEAILRRGPDDPQSQDWLWEHWGTTEALRHVVELTPDKDRRAGERLVLSFWSADWTPWRALSHLATLWPAVRFEVRPTYGVS